MSLVSGLQANVGRMLESDRRCALIGRAVLLAMLVVPLAALAQQKNESVGVLGRPPALDTAPSSKAGAGTQDARRIEQRRLQEQQQRRRQQEEQSRWREMLR
jgi:hypothetical protein